MAAIPKLGPGATRLLALAAVGALLIAAVTTLLGGSSVKTITADFPRTVSIYEGSDVRVLGVKVGQVDTVVPSGTTVKVTMTYDDTVKIPADAKAAVIAPSVVGDRFIQLTPVYTSGPVMDDGAKLGTDRTAIPLELDEIYQSIDDLAVGLGPDGANKDGALSRLLSSTARNFGGQGAQFNQTIKNLSKFTGTLDNNKDALFDTAREIDRFVQTLAQNDQTVRDFNDSLAQASTVLEGERADLSASLRNLGVAMEQISSFVKENRDALSGNIKGLVKVTDILVKQREALDETLSAAPVALANLYHTYNPTTGTLDTRASMGENVHSAESNPSHTLCSLVTTADPNGDLCKQFVEILGRAKPWKADSKQPTGVVEVERIDTSLGGILGGTR